MNRTRTHVAALATLALLGLSACGGEAETVEDPGSTPTPTVSETPSEAQSETPSQTPATPEESEAPTVSWHSQVAERSTLDVDGDGRGDSVELLVPEGTVEGDPADRAALRIGLADGTLEVEVSDEPTHVWLGITTDPQDKAGIELGGGPGAEVLVGMSQGGDSAFLGVWSWVESDGSLTQVDAVDAPRSIAVGGLLASYAERSGFTLGGEGLYSWRLVDPMSGNEATVWQWSADGTTLTATRQPGTQCVVVGELTDC